MEKQNPTIQNCAKCGSVGTYFDKDGPRCDKHRVFYQNEAQKRGYIAGLGAITKMKKEQAA